MNGKKEEQQNNEYTLIEMVIAAGLLLSFGIAAYFMLQGRDVGWLKPVFDRAFVFDGDGIMLNLLLLAFMIYATPAFLALKAVNAAVDYLSKDTEDSDIKTLKNSVNITNLGVSLVPHIIGLPLLIILGGIKARLEKSGIWGTLQNPLMKYANADTFSWACGGIIYLSVEPDLAGELSRGLLAFLVLLYVPYYIWFKITNPKPRP